MNVVKSTWRQLVRRRLWPVAVLLVVALAAIPTVLASEPEAPVAPVTPSAEVDAVTDSSIAEPVVASVTPEDRSRRRRVLGARKDPFAPAPEPKAKKAATAPSDSGGATAPKAPDQPVGGGIPVDLPPPTSGGGTVVAPAPVAPSAPVKKFAPGTVVVRFSEAKGGASAKLAFEKLSPVPDPELPLLVYMGLTKDGKRAKFLVDASVEVDGDGRCKPHPSNCETIELRVGETEFLDVVDPEADADAEDRIVAQYQLDLVDIKRAGDSDVR